MKPLTCIKCDKQPESAIGEDTEGNQPYAATAFSTYGHYGSTVFDPCMVGHPHQLEINVCDDCLRVAIKKNQVLLVTRRDLPSDFTYEIYSEEIGRERQI